MSQKQLLEQQKKKEKSPSKEEIESELSQLRALRSLNRKPSLVHYRGKPKSIGSKSFEQFKKEQKLRAELKNPQNLVRQKNRPNFTIPQPLGGIPQTFTPTFSNSPSIPQPIVNIPMSASSNSTQKFSPPQLISPNTTQTQSKPKPVSPYYTPLLPKFRFRLPIRNEPLPLPQLKPPSVMPKQSEKQERKKKRITPEEFFEERVKEKPISKEQEEIVNIRERLRKRRLFPEEEIIQERIPIRERVIAVPQVKEKTVKEVLPVPEKITKEVYQEVQPIPEYHEYVQQVQPIPEYHFEEVRPVLVKNRIPYPVFTPVERPEVSQENFFVIDNKQVPRVIDTSYNYKDEGDVTVISPSSRLIIKSRNNQPQSVSTVAILPLYSNVPTQIQELFISTPEMTRLRRLLSKCNS